MIDINTSDSPSGALNLRRVIATAEMENRAENASPISYADRVELGYKAFEIGLWELGRDNHADARRWLQTAVDIGIDDAQPLLDICIKAQRPTLRPIDNPEPKRASSDQPTPVPAANATDNSEGAGTPIYWAVAAKLSNGETPSDDTFTEQYDRLFRAWRRWRERVMPGLLAAPAQRRHPIGGPNSAHLALMAKVLRGPTASHRSREDRMAAIMNALARLGYVCVVSGDLVEIAPLAILGQQHGDLHRSNLLLPDTNGPSSELRLIDASFDTASYRQFAEGYRLSPDSMKWFWDQYSAEERHDAESTASPARPDGACGDVVTVDCTWTEAATRRDSGPILALKPGRSAEVVDIGDGALADAAHPGGPD